ncbi:MAG: endopeptidase La [Bacteroidales bacterium]|nr:endopeptidase La [Bacteroidales bacterium]
MKKFEEYELMPELEEGSIAPIFTDVIKGGEEIKDYPEVLPILPLRNSVLFPGVVIPIHIGREKSFKLIRDIQKTTKIFGALSQIDAEVENTTFNDMYNTGTVAEILKVIEMPDNTVSVIIQGKRRFKVNEFLNSEPYFNARVDYMPDLTIPKDDKDTDALVSSIKDLAVKIVKLSQNGPSELSFAIKNIEHTSFLINYIITNCNCTNEQKQNLLELNDFRQVALDLLNYLTEQKQFLDLKHEIQGKVKKVMDKQQREYLLNQQMRTIQEELGGSPTDIEIHELREKASKKKWDKKVAEIFEKEVKKLEQLNPMSAEYSIQMNYVNVFVELPWNEYSKDNHDLKYAKKVLDNDHYGLEDVKERILEHLAVLKLKGDLKSPILCLYGPPGVGKTSLGRSVATALGRNYVRMSLGGLHDEAEIRGHRRTYVGAMPGRILQNINKAKTSNPVFILDEIDKVGNDYKGDPASALLEVLDPEQNTEFHDNFIDQEYDLSKVLFMATANNISTINPALRDRMEMIEISGYITEEKLEIAKRHLIPKEFKNHGIEKKHRIKVEDSAILKIIEGYTRESGVRALDKQIAKLARRIAKKIGMEEKFPKNITDQNLESFIGKPLFHRDSYEEQERAGVVTGLAWTAVGGEILTIETSLSEGKGQLSLTGNLGDVMKESATLAMEYVKSHADQLGIKHEVFEHWNLHLHVPEGAIPKDGPSAGITMATAIASAFTQKKVKSHIAMTGEITLRGKVLPVGGIKEKILAAKRAGITEIIMSRENEKDINEINQMYLEGVSFHYVDTVEEVFKLAILDEKVKNAKNLTVKKCKDNAPT